MNIIFFDTETTGVPKNYKAPVTDVDNWPRLVQLGWLLVDSETGNVLHKGDWIVKPEGFEIPVEASNVHGISTIRALKEGTELHKVIPHFLEDLERADLVVGHNIDFDVHVVGSELFRLGLDYTKLTNRPRVCTMLSSVNYCKILHPRGGYKWPRLQELYKTLFGHEFENAHDAFADITATKECYFGLIKAGVIQPLTQ